MSSTDSEIAAYIRGLRLRREQDWARRVWYWKRDDLALYSEPAIPSRYMSDRRARRIRAEILRLMEVVA